MGKILDIPAIKRAVSRRYPMLMLDRAEIVDEKHLIGVKNVTINEVFFQGHFPNHPIMPGVLQVEAMKQLCEIGARDFLDPDRAGDLYLKVLEKVKFRRPTAPGDRLKVEAELLERDSESCKFRTRISNCSGVGSEAVLTIGVREKSAPAAMPVIFNEFDRSDASAMDVARTMSLMPHRYPFLLIDYIARIEAGRVVAVKNVTVNEEIFSHCPDDFAVMPESLLCEISAQSGCACVLSRPENEGKIGYFMSIERAEIFAPVFPGDQLVIECDLPPSKSRFGRGDCRILVDGKEVFKAHIMFAIVDA